MNCSEELACGSVVKVLANLIISAVQFIEFLQDLDVFSIALQRAFSTKP